MTITVTTQDLEQADTEAEAARAGLRDAERAYASNRSSTAAYEDHQTAIERATHAETRAKVLREDWQEQQAARDARAAAGEAAAKEMAGEVKRLAVSQQRAVKAAVKVREAMAEMLAAFGAHGDLVKTVGAELGRRGLRSADGEATGQTPDGAARIGGEAWPLVDGGSVLAALLNEAVAEHLPRHPLTRVPMPSYDGHAGVLVRRELLAQVRAARGR